MNGEIGNGRPDDDIDDDVESPSETDTIVMTEDIDDDNVGDISVEINVDELVAKIESDDGDAHKKEVHRRLEELEEKRRIEAELDSTYNFNLDDEL